jgi:hypothetical protein
VALGSRYTPMTYTAHVVAPDHHHTLVSGHGTHRWRSEGLAQRERLALTQFTGSHAWTRDVRWWLALDPHRCGGGAHPRSVLQIPGGPTRDTLPAEQPKRAVVTESLPFRYRIVMNYR